MKIWRKRDRWILIIPLAVLFLAAIFISGYACGISKARAFGKGEVAFTLLMCNRYFDSYSEGDIEKAHDTMETLFLAKIDIALRHLIIDLSSTFWKRLGTDMGVGNLRTDGALCVAIQEVARDISEHKLKDTEFKEVLVTTMQIMNESPEFKDFLDANRLSRIK